MLGKRNGWSKPKAANVSCWPATWAAKSFAKMRCSEPAECSARFNILVNNAAEQHPQESITKITEKQLERTFRTNIFSMFFMTKAAMRHFKDGGNIINTASVTAYQGSPELLDYSSTK